MYAKNVFIYVSFSDALSYSNCITLNRRMSNKLEDIWKEMAIFRFKIFWD
jgi:hypothetical protein